MEPTVLGNAFMEGGPDRKINLDRSPGIDEASGVICPLLLHTLFHACFFRSIHSITQGPKISEDR